MRTSILILFCLFSLLTNATNYYFSTSSGDDSRSSTQAQSPSTPWKTISKLNSFFSSLAPGDSVLFNRGEEFPGAITISRSGSSGSPIVIGAYGSGAKPVISGFAIPSSWTSIGNGVYESTISSALSAMNMVIMDGSFEAIGRWPKASASNSGYLAYQSFSGSSSITSNAMASAPNCVGGEVVIRKVHWVIDRGTISSQSSTSVSYSGGGYGPTSGYGFFFQNHVNCLTTLGEWSFESSSKKLRVYFGSAGPSSHTVKATVTDNLVSISSKNYITFSGLSFQGSNSKTFNLSAADHIKITGCDISFSGTDAISSNGSSNNITLSNSTINWTNNNAITAASSPTWTIQGNTFTNTGATAGMGGSGDGKYTCIYDLGTSSLVENNIVKNTGYVGINFTSVNGNGSSVIVRNNLVDTYCMVKDDGGGIYTWGGTSPTSFTARTISNNIVINGVGAGNGAGGSNTSVFGIYMDDNVADVNITGNSLANIAGSAIYMHNTRNLTISNNTCYNSNDKELRMANDNSAALFRNINVNNNIFFNKTATTNYSSFVADMRSTANDIGSFGSWDNNYYCRPMTSEAQVLFVRRPGVTDFTGTLSGWQALGYGMDAHSKKTPIAITDPNKIRFEYNASPSPKTVSLGSTYITVDGTSHAGSITLDPYSSAVLLQTSGSVNQPPASHAGTDQTIILPGNSVTLNGSGTDADGAIASYSWTKVSGPSQFNISSPSGAQTTITNLAQGIYTFQLLVTDNAGATATDVVSITVNAALVNQAPIANAGSNITITLPTITAPLNGSGSDPDGTIVSYSWSRISGPSTFNILAPATAITSVIGLIQGVYTFQLQVTDNSGAVGKDTVVVTVNVLPPPNQAPTANAGNDVILTMPTNSTTITGSGTDADGTISKYSWTKVSGPTQFQMSSPSAAQTVINNLVQGVYQFQLQVTDNSNATDVDVVTITVNAAPVNQLPVANAGNNMTITLPTSSVTLSGSGTDPDGTIASYSWTKVSGPTQFNIVSAGSAQTTINNLVEGVYQFQLKVTDNSGGTATDVVNVTVNPPVNQAPVANAGNNTTLTLPTNTSTLSGSGTDADGTISGYSWTKISGPTTFTIVSPASAQTIINNLVQGSYQFQLQVTDNDGATATDVVVITVNAAPVNQLPVANAGNNKTITLPTNTVSLTGSGTDADGTIASYSWTKVSGPTQYTIASSGNAQTAINNLVQGTYQFQLKVTDNAGGTATDVVVVTVNPAPPNQLPVANAGSNKMMTLPTNSTTITGSGTDADGTIASYSWTWVSGPTQYSITSPAAAQTTINNLVEGVYQFQLTVTDNSGGTGTDVVLVTVNPALPPPNQAPVANAGTNISITLPINSTTLNGSGTDADGTIASYAWTRVSGPTQFTLGSASSAQSTLTNLVQGTYQFQLKVTDNAGATATDVVLVTVLPAPPNQLPIANAGTDMSITLPTSTVSLTGSGTDADGTIASYSWTKISGPSTFTIVSAGTAQTDINNLVQGTYSFQLQVTDNAGGTATDVVRVTVQPAVVNQPPTVNAGNNITITLPTISVTVTGTANDPDGTIASYSWTKISGPAQFNITSPSTAQTTINNLAQGVYQFQLQVTDNSGASVSDVVFVTVNAAAPPNQAPVANAGNNVSITLPTNSLTLNGSGTDADGSIASYAWTKVSGPTQYNIGTPGTAQTTIDNLVQGVYQFQLIVTDNLGSTDADIVIVTVNAAPVNQAPFANAGNNRSITLPTNSTTLSGSGTDADGAIATYSWTKISGPTQFNIASPAAGQTTINNLVEGVYQFQLTVTDNGGATDADVVVVTVNAPVNQAPVSNAGSDITISLPTNSVTLTGIGTDADGTIASYSWTAFAGPSQFNIVSADSAQTVINGLVQGVYYFRLRVTDNGGSTNNDYVRVTVNAAPPNQAPVSNAGNNRTITLPTNSLTLNGAGTDGDGSIVTYHWTKISGPSQFNIADPDSANTVINNLVQGSYQFQLHVVDNDGASDNDLVVVTVNAPVAPPPNVSPDANAGANVAITLPTNTVSVTGVGTDSDGSIAGYNWTWISGPTQYNIVNASAAQTTINNLVQGIYQFQLQVTDNRGGTGTDIIIITVNPALVNQLPVANAGNNKTITLPTNTVTLTGLGTDNDGTIASYSWTKIAGPNQFTIVSPTTAQTTINTLVQGVYQFMLEVTDNAGGTATDVVTVTVNPAPVNQLPTADAGNNRTITLPVSSVSLNGSGSDPDGTIATYSWTWISGPTQYTIVTPGIGQTTVNNLVEGVYQFQLKVTDNAGGTATDIVSVTVNPPFNQPPVAFAGNNISIMLPVDSVSLTGAGTDADGTIASYSWTKVSGPSQYNIVTTNGANTTINNLVEGIYYFQLRVTDNDGASGTDFVKVTVNAPPPNQLPVASAGNNITIVLPNNTVSLIGSGADADGTIVTYTWLKISGPVQYNIVSPSTGFTTVNNLVQGVYQFMLQITDNAGGTATDVVIVTVNAAPIINRLPTAHAGNDIVITLPVNTVSLVGSGSDPDGNVTGYAWSKISGPTQLTIHSPGSANTNVTDLVEGVYKFQLQVTDNSGGTARDTIMVTVGPAPVIANKLPLADAGKDTIIVMPNSTIMLKGSGSDSDGVINGYYWSMVDGPAAFAIADRESPVTMVNDLAEGTYEFELKVTDNARASATDTVVVMVKNFAASTAMIYPNPVTDVMNLRIESKTASDLTSMEIYDINGRLMYKEAFMRTQQVMVKQLDVSKWPNGTYIVRVSADINTPVSLKMVKQ